MRTYKNVLLFGVVLVVCLLVHFDSFALNYRGDEQFVEQMKQDIQCNGSWKITGKTYFVAPSGKDSNKGTKASPYGTIQYACKQLQPGDVLYVRGGTYSEELRLSMRGKAGNYISILAYKDEKPVISGKGKQSPCLISLEGTAYLRIAGLTLQDAQGQDACGIYFAPNTHHVLLEQNVIKNINVENPDLQDHCANGILMFGELASQPIHNVLLYQNTLKNCQTGWAECLSVTGNCRYINIIKNRIDNIGNIGIDLSGSYGYCENPSKDCARECLVYGNKVSRCVSPYATSYGIYVDGGRNIEIVKNTVSKCSGGIEIGMEQKPKKEKYSTSGIVVKKNKVYNNIENGITIGGYSKKLGWVKNVDLIGNTVFNNGKNNAILTLAKCKDIRIINNQFANSSGNGPVVYSEFSKRYTRSITFSGNTYYNGHKKNDTCFVYRGKEYTSFDKWQKKVGDQNSIYKKPKKLK